MLVSDLSTDLLEDQVKTARESMRLDVGFRHGYGEDQLKPLFWLGIRATHQYLSWSLSGLSAECMNFGIWLFKLPLLYININYYITNEYIAAP